MHGMEKPSFMRSIYKEWAPSWMLSEHDQAQRATQFAKKIIAKDKTFLNLEHYTEYEEFKELIRNGANPDIQDEEGSTALAHAIIRKDKKFIELLLSKKASVNNCRSKLQPLTEAVSQGDITLVCQLIKAGADVNKEGSTVSNTSLDTPLNIAARDQNFEMVKNLMFSGANPDVRCSEHGNTALIAALRNPYKAADQKIVSFLLHSGLKIDARNSAGFTALMIAASTSNAWIPESDSYKIVALLIAAGANRESKDLKGKTATDYARDRSHHSIVRLLTEKKKLP